MKTKVVITALIAEAPQSQEAQAMTCLEMVRAPRSGSAVGVAFGLIPEA